MKLLGNIKPVILHHCPQHRVVPGWHHGLVVWRPEVGVFIIAQEKGAEGTRHLVVMATTFKRQN